MKYNKRQYKKVNDKKVLHKIGKQWKVISVALLLAIGGSVALTHTANANADSINNNTQTEKVAPNVNESNHTLASEMTTVASNAQLISAIDNNVSLSASYSNKYSSDSSLVNSVSNKAMDAERNYAVANDELSSDKDSLNSMQSASSSEESAGKFAKANSAADTLSISNMAHQHNVSFSTFENAVNSAATSVNSNDDGMGNIGSMDTDGTYLDTQAQINSFKQNHYISSIYDGQFNYYYLAGFSAGNINYSTDSEVTIPNLVRAVSDRAVMNSYSSDINSLNSSISLTNSSISQLSIALPSNKQIFQNENDKYQSMLPSLNSEEILGNYPKLSQLFGTTNILYPTLAKELLNNTSLINPNKSLKDQLLKVSSVSTNLIDNIPSAEAEAGIRIPDIDGGPGGTPNTNASGILSSFYTDLTQYTSDADMKNTILSNSGLIDVDALDTGEEPHSIYQFGYVNVPLLIQELSNLSTVATELANNVNDANLIKNGQLNGLLNSNDYFLAKNAIDNDKSISELDNNAAIHNTINVSEINSLTSSITGKSVAPYNIPVQPNKPSLPVTPTSQSNNLVDELTQTASEAKLISEIDTNNSLSAQYAEQYSNENNSLINASSAESSAFTDTIYASSSVASNNSAISSLQASENFENSESVNASKDVSADNNALSSLENKYGINSFVMNSAVNSAASSVNSGTVIDMFGNSQSGSMPTSTSWIAGQGNGPDSAIASFENSYNVFSVSDKESYQAFPCFYYITGFSASGSKSNLDYPDDVAVPLPGLTKAVSDRAVMNSYSSAINTINSNISSRNAQSPLLNAKLSNVNNSLSKEASDYQNGILRDNRDAMLANYPTLTHLFGQSNIINPSLAKFLLQDKELVPNTSNQNTLKSELLYVSNLANKMLNSIPDNLAGEQVDFPVLDENYGSAIQEVIAGFEGYSKDTKAITNILDVSNGLIDTSAYDVNGSSHNNDSYLNMPLLAQELFNLSTVATELSNNVSEAQAIYNGNFHDGLLNNDNYTLAESAINKGTHISNLGNIASNSANVSAIASLASSAVTSSENVIANSYAKSADQSIENSIANSAKNSADSSIANSYKNSVANSVAYNDGSIADSYSNSVSASVSSANKSKAESAANSANQSIANSAKNSADSSIANSYKNSMANSVAYKNGSIANSAKVSADNSIANSYKNSVANSVSSANKSKANSAAKSADASIASSEAKKANNKPAKPNNNNGKGGNATPNKPVTPNKPNTPNNNGGDVLPVIPSVPTVNPVMSTTPTAPTSSATSNHNNQPVASGANTDNDLKIDSALSKKLGTTVYESTNSNNNTINNKSTKKHKAVIKTINNFAKEQHKAVKINNVAKKYLVRKNFNFKRGYKNTIVATRHIAEYRRTRYGHFVKVVNVRKGSVLPVVNVVKAGKANSLKLANGLYVTANKRYVRVFKYTRKSAYNRALTVAKRNVRRARGRYAKRYAHNVVRGLVRAHKSEARAVAKFNRRHNNRNRKAMHRAEYRVNNAVRALLK